MLRVLGSVAVAVLIGLNVLLWRYGEAQASARAVAESRVDALEVELAEKRAAIDNARRATNDLVERVQKAEEQAATLSAESQKRVVRVYTAPIPSDCAGAVRSAAEWGRARGQSWSAQ